MDDTNALGRGLEALIPKKKTDDGDSTNASSPNRGELDGAHELSQVAPRHLDALPVQPTVSPPTQPAASVSPTVERTGPRGERVSDAVFLIEVDKITSNPDQPRRQFDEAALKELAASIREFGLLQPITVTKIEKETPTGTEVFYQLIAGERRLMASRLLGLPRIPAIVKNVGLERERLELAIIENIQREDLNPIEAARAFSRLQDEFRLTQREIASRLGKSREAVANTVRLLDLPPEIQSAMEERKVSESHGRLLLTIDDPALQKKLFADLLANHLTTRDLKNRVRALSAKKAEVSPRENLPPELRLLQEKLSSELGAPVAIQQSGETGKITITFYSEEELKSIIDRLGGAE